MIAYLDGRLVHKEPAFLIIDVQGVGYEVRISLNTFSSLKNEEHCRILTYLHIKEDAHTLFGFSDNAEKKIFLELISITGVGPGTALMILSSLNPTELQHAILHEDVRQISAVKGIGPKTAQRIILELKDRIMRSGFTAGDISIQDKKATHNTLRAEALTALMTLGINRAMAEKNIDKLLKDAGGEIDLETLIKQALRGA
jgi:Holliday junction DNA helicase RuvA